MDTKQVGEKWHDVNERWQELSFKIDTLYREATAPIEIEFDEESGKLYATYAKKSFLTKILNRGKKDARISELEAIKERKIAPIYSELLAVHGLIKEVVDTLYDNKSPDSVGYTNTVHLPLTGSTLISDRPESEIAEQNAAWETRFSELEPRLEEISAAVNKFEKKYCSPTLTA